MSVSSPFPTGVTLLGGIPTHTQDLAGSIIFLVLYLALMPLVGYRLASSKARCFALLRPSIFVGIRVATFAVRIYQTKGHYEIGYFIAQQILLLSGFILLCEPLVTLTVGHISRFTSRKSQRWRITRLYGLFLEVTLMGCIGISAASAGQYSSLKNSNDISSAVSTIKALRDASVAVTLAILFQLQLVLGFFHFRDYLPGWPTVHIIGTASLLNITLVYRIILFTITINPLGTTTKVTFYIIFALLEYVALCTLLIPIIKKEFALDGPEQPSEGQGRTVTDLESAAPAVVADGQEGQQTTPKPAEV
ncbi:hypothetical protein T439DRAFT_384355 [Meredithblackwellia eburnea MCA 4105]